MKPSSAQKILLLAFCLSLAAPAQSQFLDPRLADLGYFNQPNNLPVYADLDGDGYKDFIVAVASANGLNNIRDIRWRKNDGTGHFGTPQSLDAEVIFSSDLSALDVDGNGSNDLVYNNGFGLTWHANDGTGHFSDPIVFFDTGLLIYRFADLDGDGDPDHLGYLLNQSGGGNSFYWRANDGAGNFDPAVHLYLPDSCCTKSFELADMDGDADPDLVTLSSFQDSVFWHANDGSGDFGPPVFLLATPSPVLQMLPRDLDADGDNDLLFYQKLHPAPQLYWLTNTGSGLFDPAVKIILDTAFVESMASEQIIAEDMTNDGAMDICGFHNNGSGYDLIMFVNQDDGQGTFAVQNNPVPYEVDVHPLAADLDNDGLPEFIGQTGNTVLQAHNAGGGVLGTLTLQYSQIGELAALHIADLNGDGAKDLVYLGGWPDSVLLWKANDGFGGFGERKSILGFQGGFSWVTEFSIGDLDNDGDEDLAATLAVEGGTEARWFKNDGAGNFTLQPSFSNELSIRNLSDVDNDGDLDVIGLLYSGPGWFRNDGTGIFTFGSSMPVQHQEQLLSELADLDGDGDPDLIASNYDHDFYWYANDGQGVFGSTDHFIANYLFSPTLTTADPDQDNDLDILRGGFSAGWWVNDGLGNFNDTLAIDNGYTATTQVAGADMDQDGDTDLLAYCVALFTGSYIPQPIRYYENLGGGQFAARVNMGIPLLYKEVVPGDLDDDGDLDVAYVDYGPIGWFRNVGDTPYIRGACFWDQNADGNWNNGEPPLANVGINLQPAGQVDYTDSTGAFRFFVSSGTYFLSPVVESCWSLSNTSFYQTTVADTVVHGLLFGFIDISNEQQVYPVLGSGFPRCDTVAAFFALLDNQSCLPSAGKFALTLDSLVTYLSSEPPPALVVGDTLIWNFDTLAPWTWAQIELQMQVADANHVGDTIHLQGFTWVEKPGGVFTLSDSALYLAEIRCSFDPNDKLVNRPAVPPGYLPDDHELVYTIRFQNTGNDTAFAVRLLDTLSPGLNWSSFRPLGASHPYNLLFNTNTGLLQFKFDPIQLPDSATNAVTSQGFVQFAIKLQPWLQPGDLVENRAGIYFDANPVVLTNTAETRVSMPSATHSPKPVSTLFVEPNPTGGACTLHFLQAAGEEAAVQLFDAQGRLLHSFAVPQGSLQFDIDLEKWPAGLYWLRWSEPGRPLVAGKVLKI